MNLKNKVLLLLSLFMFGSIFSQKRWTLEDCVSYAITNNLNLKDFELTTASGKETYKQSFREMLPSVSGFSDYNLTFGRSEDPNTGLFVNSDFFSNNYSLNASLDLFQGFQKLNMIKASKYLYKANMEDVKRQKFLLAFRVMSAFYDIQYYEGLLAISNSKVKVSKTNLVLVKKQIELGIKAGADIHEAKSTLLTDELEVTQNSNLLQEAKLRLIQEINLEGESTIEIYTELLGEHKNEQEQKQNTDSIFTYAKEFLPTIKAQELRVKAAKKEIKAARGALYPSLRLFAGIGTGYFETNTSEATNEVIPFKTQIEDNMSKRVGVSLNVPISDKWSRRSRVKQQKIAYMRANNNLKIQEQQLYQTIQQLIQSKNALAVEYEQSFQQMNAGEQTFKIAQKKYQKGLISALDLNQAKNLFATSQNKNLQVGLLLKVNSSTLDFYRGLPVFNINMNN
ncbi:TolC family protein [uncultured Maribacter sp.]|uniref:TolC family protein n=1 Tax=uncultured Maribacter sp. TaxID=431308 RepID=UPI00261BF555|nr:TolC family protein [uncultured Maribacter sp.]